MASILQDARDVRRTTKAPKLNDQDFSNKAFTNALRIITDKISKFKNGGMYQITLYCQQLNYYDNTTGKEYEFNSHMGRDDILTTDRILQELKISHYDVELENSADSMIPPSINIRW